MTFFQLQCCWLVFSCEAKYQQISWNIPNFISNLLNCWPSVFIKGAGIRGLSLSSELFDFTLQNSGEIKWKTNQKQSSGSISSSDFDWVCEWRKAFLCLTVLKLGKRLSGEEPLTLRGRKCSSWDCGWRARPGRGRALRSGWTCFWVSAPKAKTITLKTGCSPYDTKTTF